MRIIQSDYPRPLNLLAVGPNGLVAVASSTFGAPGDIEVWDATTGTKATSFACQCELFSLAFDATSSHLFVAGDSLGIVAVSTTTGTILAELDRVAGFLHPKLALTPDGVCLLVTSEQLVEGGVECWSATEGLQFRRRWAYPNGPRGFLALAVIPSGDRGATAELSEWNDGRPRLDVTVRDLESGKVETRFTLDPASPVRQLAFTADGAQLLVRTESRTVQLFDTATGAPAGELVHTGRPYVTAVAVHPCGAVACARTNGTVTFWDVTKREQLRTLDWKAGKLVSVAFGPDGALGAAGTESGQVVVWDVDL